MVPRITKAPMIVFPISMAQMTERQQYVNSIDFLCVNRLYYCQIDAYSEVLDSDNVIDVGCDNMKISNLAMMTKM